MIEQVVIVQPEIVRVAVEGGPTLRVDAGVPGPPGPPGSPATGDPGDFFQTALRLAELDTDAKRQAARANLGLATIDGGEFFTATP